ncbi:HopJ type III effector protein [Vibrio ruber]|uniref:HopJ type III effector protein n=1 Tax=Vibrio ruber TaxID=184755 RepID=UPI002892B8A2|nr:HopJ type III effector protein [Vibrio ruber]WNJ97898.1 HopJ type III effector protein [Vibrio ruber]
MILNELLNLIRTSPEQVDFAGVMGVIDEYYDFTPTRFSNGDVVNAAQENQGSCKIFSFAQLHQLSAAETLACFGDFYRQDVLQHPENQDHQNIRNFIRTGWEGVRFEGKALAAKS